MRRPNGTTQSLIRRIVMMALSLQMGAVAGAAASVGPISSTPGPAPDWEEPLTPVAGSATVSRDITAEMELMAGTEADDAIQVASGQEAGLLIAANETKKTRKRKRKTKSASGGSSKLSEKAGPAGGKKAKKKTQRGSEGSRLGRARELAAAGKYAEASKLLFPLTRGAAGSVESIQAKYILGMMLFEMKLYQTSAFVFYDIVGDATRVGDKADRYLRLAFEKLSLSADALDSDILLRYAIKRVDEKEFPAAHRDMYFYRSGELRMADNKHQEAAQFFAKVRQESPYFPKAKYMQALALADSGELEKAQGAFEDLAIMSESEGVTDVNRVSALLGKARVLYQRQKWDGSLDAYREIPRDTEQWHEALFESTWANLRSAKFRSALSNFHSLHSDYYEDFYQPESLILRAIVYVYICRYDEMEKVLGLFDRIYKPVARQVGELLKSGSDPLQLYRELARVKSTFASLRANRGSRKENKIPFLVARHILKESDVRHGMRYIARLEVERKRINSTPGGWARSAVGLYAKKAVERRLQSAQSFVGKLVKRHLTVIGRELLDISEQKDLLVLETLSGKRETIKKEIAGKGLAKPGSIDEDNSRDFLIQNGYEYWPFKGEYWLDEIGNYHYVGVQACE